jgi:hypothetical protein
MQYGHSRHNAGEVDTRSVEAILRAADDAGYAIAWTLERARSTHQNVMVTTHGVADEVDYRADAWDPLKVCARIYSYSSPEH